MADTDTPETDAKKPVSRRRAPRKTSVAKPVATSAKAKPVATPAKAKPAAATAPASIETPVAPKPAKPTPKPRSTKRSTPRATAPRKAPARKAPVPVATMTDKIGGKWGAAAIAGGVAVIGAVAALFSLRGSTSKPDAKRAHQADGTDSSKSFEAGIADEGTIPE